MNLLLGSQSPRRQELLQMLGLPFTIVNINCEEHFPSHLKREDIPVFLSEQKADAYHRHLQEDDVLLTADTIVWVEHLQQMLGKPSSIAHAKQMIETLSGRTHQVYTGVHLRSLKKKMSFSCRTDVSFRTLTEEEIDYYVRNYHPLDKAGAYGIQEWIGAAACTSINGSYFNVMGLPTNHVWEALKEF